MSLLSGLDGDPKGNFTVNYIPIDKNNASNYNFLLRLNKHCDVEHYEEKLKLAGITLERDVNFHSMSTRTIGRVFGLKITDYDKLPHLTR